MIALAISVIFGLGFAYFATQNTEEVKINLIYDNLTNVPMYVIVLGSLLAGILLSWLMNFVNSIPERLAMRGKEFTIKEAKKEIAALTRQVHQLEIENVRLNTEKDSVDEKSL